MSSDNLAIGKEVLVHSCCAHCAAATVSHWRGQGYHPRALWYNPNIHPFAEHEKRRESLEILAGTLGFQLDIIPGYDLEEYFRRITGQEPKRCRHCFELRLGRTAEYALELRIPAFTTTLLISPHQKHEELAEIGEGIARARGLHFLYADLRKAYSESRRITKPMELHRQQYCGCIYSEWERHAGEPGT